MSIPCVMAVLSRTLLARVIRATNLVVPSLHIPVTVFGAVGEPRDWAFFYNLSIGIEVLILACIVRADWSGPRTHADADDVAPAVRR